jgi:opacity protein-like surface antigen
MRAVRSAASDSGAEVTNTVTHSNAFALTLALTVASTLSLPVGAMAQQEQPPPPPPATPRAATPRAPLGVDIFGSAGIGWPAANDSFKALDLNELPLEYGGGVRATNLWRYLFAQVAVNRWSDSGERAFVDSEGTAFPLGIPLDVEATYVDATIGWKWPTMRRDGSVAAWTYAGAGAGVTMYSESSPFAEPGDDIDESKVTYNFVAGGEFPITRQLAITFEGRYRYVPGLLGESGVSEALGEETFGGFGIGGGVRIGFGGGPAPVTRPSTTDPAASPIAPPSPGTIPVQPSAFTAAYVLNEAPVFLLPDRTRTPLRVLAPGTSLRIVEENKEWYRVQFSDPQFGPRIGWIERKFVQIGKS